MQGLPYVSLGDLAGRSHVMLDGAARPGTVLTLSHWPHSPTPRALWRDLSVEIAFAYISGDCLVGDLLTQCLNDHQGVVATIDHVDVDGLASLLVATAPDLALEYRDLLVDAASVDDFDVIGGPDSTLIAHTMRALIDSPQIRRNGASQHWSTGGDRVNDLLEVFVDLLRKPDKLAEFAEHEQATMRRSFQAFESGAARLSEYRSVALAVVEVDGSFAGVGSKVAKCHETGIHIATIRSFSDLPRVLVIFDDGRAIYYDRYETWVRYVSRQLLLRRDLGPLAVSLTKAEPSGVVWVADPPSASMPVLTTSKGVRSGLDTNVIVSTIRSYLEKAKPAFDPFSAGI